MTKHTWTLTALALAGTLAAAPAFAGPSASYLNRLVSLCQTGDYASCTAYNQAVFGAYQERQQAQRIEPATVRVDDNAGTAARQPSPGQRDGSTAVAQTNQ